MSLIDPDKGAHILVVGRKGSGKSHLARRLFDTYPYDTLVLDVTGDLWRDFRRDGLGEPGSGIRLHKLTSPLPVNLARPLERDGLRQVYVFTPDMGSPTAGDDLDRAVGLALRRGRMMIWGDEVGVIAPANKTGSDTRRYLHHGRHHQITGVWCGPRPVDIDPLMLAQADHGYVFALANPNDRRRLADAFGWPPKDFDEAVHGLGEHEYLHWDAQTHGIDHFPPLPPRRQATGPIPAPQEPERITG